MFKYIIQIYKEYPETKTKTEWIEMFYNLYLEAFYEDRKFKALVRPTTKHYDKKMEYIIEKLGTGTSKITIEDIQEEDFTGKIWD